MNKNLALIPFLAVITLLSIGSVSALDLASPVITKWNGFELIPGNVPVKATAFFGQTVPIEVGFLATRDAEDVRVKVRIEGHRDDISASSERFNIVKWNIYTKRLELKLPSDSKKLSRNFTLYVEISNAQYKTEVSYKISLQRESFALQIQSVDYPSTVLAGTTVPVSVVAKNRGYNDADDVYVKVSIPALNIEVKGFIGDLVAVKKRRDDKTADEKTVFLKIPENAKAGVYDMEVEVYNDDSSTTVKRLISVSAEGTLVVLAADKSKNLEAGETVKYNIILVNKADSVRIVNLKTISGGSLTVSAPSVVTVGPKTDKVVEVSVTAPKSAKEGTYTFTLMVDGQEVTLGANVVSEQKLPSSTVALTVILVIIFVVLLAILIVLLTRKEKPAEEAETSYY